MAGMVEVVLDLLPVILARLEPEAQAIIDDGAAHIADRAKELIETSPAGGRNYRGHQASAPGEPPANWSGELLGSIAAHPHTGNLQSEVHVDSGHGIYLEFGTSKMAPRPFLTPAAEEEQPKLEAALAALIGGLP